MKIYVMRHGETDYNKEGRLQGWVDNPLNDYGVLLAEETGKGMKEAGIKFDAAFSSSLKRAKKTAEIVLEKTGCGDVDVQIDDRIIEINMGDWEGKKFKPGEAEIDTVEVRKFFDNPLKGGSFPGGEGVRDAMVRTQEFLRELAEKDYKSVLVSSHGCAVRAMLNFMYEEPNRFWQGRVPLNCAVNIIEVNDGKFEFVEKDAIFYPKDLIIDRYVRF